MPKKYDGTDFSADWKVVTFEGKTMFGPWKIVKEDNEFVLVFSDSFPHKPLVGFSNYRFVLQAAQAIGGTAVRQ